MDIQTLESDTLNLSFVIDALENNYGTNRVAKIMQNILNLEIDKHLIVDCYSIVRNKQGIKVKYMLE